MRVLESLNTALHDLLREDQDIHLIGEDVCDPYGGAFKVTKGLSTAYPDRVLSAPISESGLVGLATGLAIKGKPAIAELMFGDFIALAADQIVNHAAKFQWMYNGQVQVPLVVRAPMGARRGYGATHSQSLEKHFCGVPGLTVLAVNEFGDPGGLLRQAVAARSPHVFIENKVMYARPLMGPEALPRPEQPDVVIVSYGGCLEHAVRAAESLVAEDEIDAKVVAIEQLHPFPDDMLRVALAGCRRVLTVEEGSPGWGFGAACARALIGHVLHFQSLTGPDHPIPSSRDWEDAVLPDHDSIRAACLSLYERD